MSIIGATEGVIMPIIMTTHITNTATNSMGCHGALTGIIHPWPAGIMRKPVMSMPPIHISLASQTRSDQASAVMIASAVITIARSRRSTASSALIGVCAHTREEVAVT